MIMKYCIIFAGPIGCSKTTVANYLSYKLGLPVFNNDAVRAEVTADLKRFDQDEYSKRRDERLGEIYQKGLSFIYDASVDREHDGFKKATDKYGYKYKIISFDLSEKFLRELYSAEGYNRPLKKLIKTIKDHDNFLKNSGLKISAHITDKNFKNRLKISYEAVK
jgi:hypothetical protein